MLVEDLVAHERPGPEFQFGALDHELRGGEVIESREMVLMKMRDDDCFDFLSLDAEVLEQLGRLDEIFPLCPLRRDVLGMVAGVDDTGPLGPSASQKI